MTTPRAICVYCGAQSKVAAHYLEAAKEFGKSLAEQDITLVYGGGNSGMMGAVANAVMEFGGKVVGVFPEELKGLEVEHKGLTEIHIVSGMHDRKKLMFDRSDGFVVLPGGFGTLDETFEMITWRQLGFHNKPIIIYNHQGYWDHWVALSKHIIEQGFAPAMTSDCYRMVDYLDDVIPAVFGEKTMGVS
jgi:uncharacterized protein (TIGR00730 family)